MASVGTAAPARPASAPASTSGMQLRAHRKSATPTNSGSSAPRRKQPKKVEEPVCEVGMTRSCCQWTQIEYLCCAARMLTTS